MAKLLHILASPRGDRSASIAVADAFISTYLEIHPSDSVEILNVWQTDLPEFNGSTLDAKYTLLSGGTPAAEEAEAWETIESIISRFKSADKILVSLPMWNFGIPYKLKHFIDILIQPGLTFSFTPEEGYKGLVIGKPLTAIFARGGAYAPGTGGESYDQQSAYIKQVFGFIGFTDIHEIFVEPTLAGPDAKQQAIDSASETASRIAASF